MVGGEGEYDCRPDPLFRNNPVKDALGISKTNVVDHNSHFHIYLAPPAPVDIGPHLLLANATSALPVDAISSDVTLQTEAQSLLDYSQTLITGDELMFIMDVPNVPAQETPIVLAQASSASTVGATLPPDYLLTTCKQTESTGDPTSAGHAVDPAGMLAVYIGNREGRDIYDDQVAMASIKVTMLQSTTVGKITTVVDNTGRSWYRYDAPPGYEGNDKATFMAEYQGKRYKIVVNLVVTPTVGESPLMEGEKPVCPPPKLIKVNGKPVSGTLDIGPGYSLDSLTVTIADLTGGALGQATGTNITLDDNAAGHNWFIDTTPGDNSEFLPTSNPYEWVAKEGSAAYGKMDMLSVLLHEYGHALGIDHSADGHDYMATTLTAGVRRMPSAEELALMQQLVGEVKVEMASVSTQGSGNTPSQLPLLPLGGFGLAFLGRLRSSRYGSLNVEADLSTLVTQYAVTANAKLLNGTFTAVNNLPESDGWATLGKVDFANGAATLKEVATSQTRLNQVFVVNPRDRFLSFTIAGSVLDNVTGAPDDAFEVALLDANTGQSLAGAFSLTHSDAMLNLQADGTETAASSVTRVTNPDGSRTYRIDLAGIAVGTAVNLSFDLIGFGKSTSQVTVRDVRVSGLPELHDDAATMNEDGSLAFDPFAQVDNAALLQLGSHVVDAAAHGSVTVNADGTFVYTPAANYFGTDSFTYRLNDGSLESNLAKVEVTVTSVNDAPVAADVYATIAEDTPLQITLGNFATDVDSNNVTTQVITGPAHGVLTQNADGSYSYTADANYNGTDSFTYKVSDGELDSNVATVSLTIGAVNDAPQGTSTTVTTLEDTPYVFQLADFGYSDANDLVGAQASRLHADGTSAIQWDNFTAVTLSSLPQAGNLTLNGLAVAAGQRINAADIAAGLLIFTPAANANGAAYAGFTFNVQDDGGTANGGVDTDQTARTLTLNVTAVNDAPVAVDLNFTTDEDVPLSLNLLVSVTDIDSAVLTPILIAGPTHGQLQYNADGSFNYVADLNYFGADSFTYKANDAAFAGDVSALDSNIVTVSLSIAAVNDAPVALAATVTGTEDTPYIFTWSDFRVSDLDSDNLFIIINNLQNNGLLQYFDGLLWTGVIAGQRISNGSNQTIRIISEATSSQCNGRGAMIDDIKLTEAMPINTGYQDSAIRLSAVLAV